MGSLCNSEVMRWDLESCRNGQVTDAARQVYGNHNKAWEADTRGLLSARLRRSSPPALNIHDRCLCHRASVAVSRKPSVFVRDGVMISLQNAYATPPRF